jgi:hypothetical protein
MSVNYSVSVEDYPPFGFALFGNTKPYRNDIKELGGKFNENLQGPNGTKRPGWIFFNKSHNKSDIARVVDKWNKNPIAPEPETVRKTITVTTEMMSQLFARLDNLEAELAYIKDVLELGEVKKEAKPVKKAVVKQVVKDEEESEEEKDVVEEKPKRMLQRKKPVA